MEKFIYPEHPAHAPYRDLTQQELVLTSIESSPVRSAQSHLLHRPSKIPLEVVFPRGGAGRTNKEVENHFFRSGGVNLSSKDLYETRGIRSVALRIRAQVDFYCPLGSGPCAYEILNYGIGAFQDLGTPPVGPEALLHLIPQPRIASSGMTQYEVVAGGSVYARTNLIHADVLGELEQLRSRRSETELLENYLQGMRKACEIVDFPLCCSSPHPYGLGSNYHIPRAVKEAWLVHIDEGKWNTVPENPGELLERVDFILDNTEIDLNPLEVWNYKDLKYSRSLR